MDPVDCSRWRGHLDLGRTGRPPRTRRSALALALVALALVWLAPPLPAVAQEDDTADLRITTFRLEDEFAILGQESLLIVVVDNDGPSDATNTRLDIELPQGVTRIDDPPFGACPNNATNPRTITCDLESFEAGDTLQEELWLYLAPATLVPVTFRASLRSSTPDPDNSNNVVASTPEAIRSVSLAVAVDAPETVAPGSEVDASVSITNRGDTDAFDLDLVLTPAPGLLDVTLAPEGQPATATTTAALDTLPAGETVTYDITGTVAADAAGTLTTTIRAAESAEGGFGRSATWDLVVADPPPTPTPAPTTPPAADDPPAGEDGPSTQAPGTGGPRTGPPSSGAAVDSPRGATGAAAPADQLPATGAGLADPVFAAVVLGAVGLLVVLGSRRRRHGA